MEYSKSKEVIHATSILSDEDANFIDNHISEIQANWEKKQLWRTETEMRVSVLNDIKFPTPAAKYWQCVREQSVFYEQLVHESFHYQRTEIKLEKVRRKLAKLAESDKPNRDLTKRELEIEEQEIQFTMLNLRQSAKDRVRELRLWSKLMAECVAQDRTFDTENVDNHQLVSYLQRWQHQMRGLAESKSSVSEVNNLVGQYATGLVTAMQRGIKLDQSMLADAQKLGVLPAPKKTEFPGLKASFRVNK